MLPSALSFLAGILLVLQLPDIPSLAWGLFVLPAMPLSYRYPRLLPSVFFIAGVFWISLRADSVIEDKLSPFLEGQDIWIEGKVSTIPRQTSFGRRFVFEVTSFQSNIKHAAIPRRIQLSQYRPQIYPDIGEHWRLRVRLKQPHGFQNPGGFDYEAYLFQKRIRARGYIRSGSRIQGIANSSMVTHARKVINSSFNNILVGNPHAGIFAALAIGSRNGISQDQWQVFRATGTSHLMAISGLHIGLIAGLGFFVSRWLWAGPGNTVLKLPAPKAGAIGGLLLGITYAALAGFTIPTQRALVMLTIAMGALFLSKRIRPPSIISLTLFVVLLLDPLAPLSAGFWLSFLAVIVIIISSQQKNRTAKPLVTLLNIQWALAIALLPVTMFLFQSASLVAPVANLVAVPLFAFIVVPFTMLAALTSLWLPTAVTEMLLVIPTFVFDCLWQLLQWIADSVPLGNVAVSGPVMLVSAIGAAILLLPGAVPARWLGLLAFLPIVFPPTQNEKRMGEFSLTLLDVGQGLSAVVQTRNHTLVYDTGPRFSPQFDTGKAVVAPYLRYSGVTIIDTLMISHGDNDHVGGAQSLMKEVPAKKVFGSLSTGLTNVESCFQGLSWTWDKVGFEVISPPQHHTPHGNNGSCVLRISSNHGSLLLTGDIEREQEEWLVDNYDKKLDSDVLVVPHHGSRTSSSAKFIEQVSPVVALFPVGYRNRYRHPNGRVVNRYRIHGSDILTTASAGAITMTFGEKGLSSSGYRQQNRRFWMNQPD